MIFHGLKDEVIRSGEVFRVIEREYLVEIVNENINGGSTCIAVYKPRGETLIHSAESATVNWSAIGSVSAADARIFAEALGLAADIAEELNCRSAR